MAADYVETWIIIQDINMVPLDDTASRPAEVTYGNNNLKAYGESYIHAGSNGTDISQAAYALDFFKLGEDLNDQHYKDVAKNITHNTMIYTDLGNKSGAMDNRCLLYTSPSPRD